MRRLKLRDKLKLSRPVEAKHEIKDGKFILNLPPISEPLPKVSVVTITKDREHLFPIPIYNWTHFQYPQDLIEWVIIDDSKTNNLQKLLPQDNRIKYYYLEKPMNIGDKRNYGVSRCTGTIIVNMDDDDIHFNDSILAKVRVLLTYDKKCVFSLPVGVYDLKTGSSMISDSSEEIYLESSMAFYKDFWAEGKFKAKPPSGEWYYFAKGRTDKFINIPFWFNFLLCNHGKNETRGRECNSDNTPSFDLILSEDVKSIIRKVRESL